MSNLGPALKKNLGHSVDLTAGHCHRMRIEYINLSDRAELKLL